MPSHSHHAHQPRPMPPRSTHSVLAWPAWRRVLVVLPLLLLLWLAVWWANEGVAPW